MFKIDFCNDILFSSVGQMLVPATAEDLKSAGKITVSPNFSSANNGNSVKAVQIKVMSRLSNSFKKKQEFGVSVVNMYLECESLTLSCVMTHEKLESFVILCTGARCGDRDPEGWTRWPVDNPSRTAWTRT